MARHRLVQLSATALGLSVWLAMPLPAQAYAMTAQSNAVERPTDATPGTRMKTITKFNGSTLPTEADLDTPTIKHLILLAQREKVIHGFGMPANWANLGQMWDAFDRRFGVKPEYRFEGGWSSWQEIEAFKTEQHPALGDVGDVGISYGPIAVKEHIVAAYKNSH